MTARPTKEAETQTRRTIRTICEALPEPSSPPDKGLLVVLLFPSLSVVVELLGSSVVVEFVPVQAKRDENGAHNSKV